MEEETRLPRVAIFECLYSGAHCYSLLGNPTQKSKTLVSAYGGYEEFDLWGYMPSQPFWLPRELVGWLWASGLVGRSPGAPDAQVPFPLCTSKAARAEAGCRPAWGEAWEWGAGPGQGRRHKGRRIAESDHRFPLFKIQSWKRRQVQGCRQHRKQPLQLGLPQLEQLRLAGLLPAIHFLGT